MAKHLVRLRTSILGNPEIPIDTCFIEHEPPLTMTLPWVTHAVTERSSLDLLF